jgi:hypothetical protein
VTGDGKHQATESVNATATAGANFYKEMHFEDKKLVKISTL